jgi:hypothetical protein
MAQKENPHEGDSLRALTEHFELKSFARIIVFRRLLGQVEVPHCLCAGLQCENREPNCPANHHMQMRLHQT